MWGVWKWTIKLGPKMNKSAFPPLEQEYLDYQAPLYHAAIPWRQTTTATPLADLRVALTRDWFTPLWVHMNQQTYDWLVANTNQADLGGRTYTDLNTLLRGEGLPPVYIYDAGYEETLHPPSRRARLGHWLHLRPLFYPHEIRYVRYLSDGIAMMISTEARCVITHV